MHAKQFQAKFLIVTGGLLGLLFYYLYVIFLMNIKEHFFSKADATISNLVVVQNWGPVDYWLDTGLLVFFVIAGIYILNSDKLTVPEKNRAIALIKSAVIGFLLYIPITAMFYIYNLDISYRITVAGGYICILVIYLIFRRKRV
jgi:succinate dehydrogenase/fumarate reductase cytochrome b subunit